MCDLPDIQKRHTSLSFLQIHFPLVIFLEGGVMVQGEGKQQHVVATVAAKLCSSAGYEWEATSQRTSR